MIALVASSGWLPAGADAAMTLEQMRSLAGATQLDNSVKQLFRNCGLPVAILDHAGESSAKQRVDWRGIAMRLSPMNWDALYGPLRGKPPIAAAWTNRGTPDGRCSSDATRLRFHAKGEAGVVTVTKKASGFGYVTSYRVPKDLYAAHKVVSVEAVLAKSLTVGTLVGRYGRPDEVLKQPGSKDIFRYWVLTLRENRPETLHAADFEIDGDRSSSFAVSTNSVEFVQERLDLLLRKWERDYVLD